MHLIEGKLSVFPPLCFLEQSTFSFVFFFYFLTLIQHPHPLLSEERITSDAATGTHSWLLQTRSHSSVSDWYSSQRLRPRLVPGARRTLSVTRFLKDKVGRFPNEPPSVGVQDPANDLAWNGSTRPTSAVLPAGEEAEGASQRPSRCRHSPILDTHLYFPLIIVTRPTLSPVCFSLLSSPAVISNQPMALSFSPQQWPVLLRHLIPARRAASLPLARDHSRRCPWTRQVQSDRVEERSNCFQAFSLV